MSSGKDSRYFKPIQTYPRVDLVLNFCFMEAAQRNGLVIANKTPQWGALR